MIPILSDTQKIKKRTIEALGVIQCLSEINATAHLKDLDRTLNSARIYRAVNLGTADEHITSLLEQIAIKLRQNK